MSVKWASLLLLDHRSPTHTPLAKVFRASTLSAFVFMPCNCGIGGVYRYLHMVNYSCVNMLIFNIWYLIDIMLFFYWFDFRSQKTIALLIVKHLAEALAKSMLYFCFFYWVSLPSTSKSASQFTTRRRWSLCSPCCPLFLVLIYTLKAFMMLLLILGLFIKIVALCSNRFLLQTI